MTLTLVMLPSAEPGTDVERERPSTDRGTQQPVDLDDLAANRLAEARRRLADLLQQVVGRIPAIDVAGRDLGDGDVVVCQGQLAAVVGHPANAVEIAGLIAVEHEDLTAATGRRERFTVDADEPCGLLDDSVRLAGHDVAVVTEADVQRLAAAAQGQVQVVGRGGSSSADGHAALELGDGATERLAQIDHPRGHMMGHHRRDHLGVGRDRPGDAQAVMDLDVGVVVDVAVEHGDHVRSAADLFELLAVQRVAVGLADDPDARPTGVAEHAEPRVGMRQSEAQQVVAGNRGAKGASVVAELADLGSCLVHEAEAVTGDAHRAVLEQRIGVAFEQHPLQRRVRHRQAVVPHEQVQPGRVAAAHLESIERRQRLLHCQVAGQSGDRAVASGQRLDLAPPCADDHFARPTWRRGARSTLR